MRTIPTVLLTLLSFSVWGQEDEKKIRSDANLYFDLLESNQISEALDYIHPEMLEMIGKEAMEQQYASLSADPRFIISMGEFEIQKVSTVFEFESIKYAVINYAFKLYVAFSEEKSNDKLSDLLVGTYKRQYGEENVTYDSETSKITISPSKEMFAINSSTFEGWKLIEYEESLKVFLIGIIPDGVFTHFKK